MAEDLPKEMWQRIASLTTVAARYQLRTTCKTLHTYDRNIDLAVVSHWPFLYRGAWRQRKPWFLQLVAARLHEIIPRTFINWAWVLNTTTPKDEENLRLDRTNTAAVSARLRILVCCTKETIEDITCFWEYLDSRRHGSLTFASATALAIFLGTNVFGRRCEVLSAATVSPKKPLRSRMKSQCARGRKRYLERAKNALRAVLWLMKAKRGKH